MLSGDRSKNIGMLLLLDVDHFQLLNDTQGHEVGDRLLQEIARRLLDSVRAEDTVARFGGDEFAVIIEHLGEQTPSALAQAELVADKIHSAMSQSLGLEVVAEGVETAMQRDSLRAGGCAIYQGYLFGRPLPIDEWPHT